MLIRTEEQARTYRKEIEKAAGNLDDRAATESPDFYGGMLYDGSLIKAGTRKNFGGVLYKAAADLWDTAENTPEKAPNLWEKVLYHNGVRIIPVPITVTARFAKDELGYWEEDGCNYRSKVNDNVYTPAEYAANWEKV